MFLEDGARLSDGRVQPQDLQPLPELPEAERTGPVQVEHIVHILDVCINTMQMHNFIKTNVFQSNRMRVSRAEMKVIYLV